MPKSYAKSVMNLCTVVGLIFCGLFIWYGLRHELFTSQEALRTFIAGFGVFGTLVFVLFQAVQVVVPILPGGLGCLAGVLLFGPWTAFWLARIYGRPLLNQLFAPKTIARYESWTEKHFSLWFALAIFFPVAPDDFLCWLAGTTDMSLKRFTAIILLGKPASIALYSLGLEIAFQWLSRILPV